jgi:adenine/guanine/hypoxanthine permease
MAPVMRRKSRELVFGQKFGLESQPSLQCKSLHCTTCGEANLNTSRAYIISVNASILTDTGGTCKCNDPVDPTCMQSNDFGTQYSLCLQEINRDLITATAVISGLATLAFGFLTNLPVALA